MMTLETIRTQYKDDILSLAKKRGVDDVRVFGSFVRGEQKSDSDIDILVNRRPTTDLMDLGGLYSDLNDLLPITVDLVTEGGLIKEARDNILMSAVKL